MRLVTWNVNSLKARLPRLLELLEEHRPDVVCLQETKAALDAFPHLDLAAAGYTAVDHSAGRWAGVAILARDDHRVDDVVRGLEGEVAPQEARWLEATVDGVRVVSVYVPNGRALGTPTFEAKLRFLEAMERRVRALLGSAQEGAGAAPARSLVVAGDMNVCLTDADVYDPAAFVGSTHVTEDERSRLRAVLAAGLVDAYRALHPDEVGFTWWDYRAGHFHKRMGLRLDLVLLSHDLAERLEHCGIDRSYRKGPKPSDHAPVLVDLRG
ncbi:MAG TPA: exodeoxyribonuclease III [Egibacteraceae bacterium]